MTKAEGIIEDINEVDFEKSNNDNVTKSEDLETEYLDMLDEIRDEYLLNYADIARKYNTSRQYVSKVLSEAGLI